MSSESPPAAPVPTSEGGGEEKTTENPPLPVSYSGLGKEPDVKFDDEGGWRIADDGTIFRKGRTKYANGDVFDGKIELVKSSSAL